MKTGFKLFLTALLALAAIADSYAQNFTNKGKEFWVGYGHHQSMEPPDCAGDGTPSNDMNMVLYLSADQAATVTVTIDNSVKLGFPNGFKRVYNLLPNQVIKTEPLPKGSRDAAASGSDINFDARLFDNPFPLGTGGEGVWKKKGIHIESTVPIVAYAHIYSVTNSGATMLLPVETWGYSYTSINSAQNSATNAASWMYVIAKDNNTRIRVTPTQASKLGKPANAPFEIILQKGEIYQYIATADCGGNGPELTGTKIKSIVGADGKCHPIAVFSGSGRTGGEPLVCGSGSRDNDMQQAFPEHAWGKRYLTAPFSNASSSTNLQPASFQTNIYKIVTKEPGTKVKKNGQDITFSGNVYTYASNTADYIEADKPIMVAQFMSGSSPCRGGLGDPEMVYISPIEQAINNIGFYRNDQKDIDVNYLTLIVPTTGLSSLFINNSQLFSHTYAHPNLAGFTVVIKGWAAEQEQVLVKCDEPFTAITYGLGSAESYGYNAGTYLKNLAAQGEIYNKPDQTNAPRTFTCTGTPMEITALFPYQPTNMVWKLSALGTAVTPNADITVSNPTPTGTIVIGPTTYYRYKLPGTYVFKTAGIYLLPIVNTATDADNCGIQETSEIKLEVRERPSSDFVFTHTGCRTDNVIFTGPASTGSYAAAAWTWDFGDNTASGLKNPTKLYAATGEYLVSLVVSSTEGCLSDTTKKKVTIEPARIAGIITSAQNGCMGSTFLVSDTTTVTSGSFYWDFGFGAPVTLNSNAPQSISFPAPGKYTIKHVIHPTGNCVSDTVTKEIEVFAKPAKPTGVEAVNYCQNTAAAALSATALPGHILTWYDNAGLNNGSQAATVPPTNAPGTYNYYVTQTSDKGCVSDALTVVVTITPALSGNVISSDQNVCPGSAIAPLTGTDPIGGNNSYTYQWYRSIDGGATWIDILGATTPSFDPTIFVNINPGTSKFRRVVTSGLCNHTSNEVSIAGVTSMSNYNIGSSQTICEGTPPDLLVGQVPTGGAGNYTYRWEVSSDGTNWSGIGGATAKDYQPGSLAVKTYYRRIASDGSCPVVSSAVVISINPTANGSISTTTADICDYETGSVVFTPTAGTAPFAIQLGVTDPNGNTTIINRTGLSNNPATIAILPAGSLPGTYTIALQSISDNGACSRTTGLNRVTIIVTQKPVVTVSPASASICKGNTVALTANGATTYTWTPSADLNSATGNQVIAKPGTSTTYTVQGAVNGCTGSTTVLVSVKELPEKPVVSSPVAYCQNATPTALVATAAANHTLIWYTNQALTAGVTAAPTPSTASAGTTAYYVTQTNSDGCASEASTINVIVYSEISNNTITADQTVCAGTPVATLNGSTASGGNGSMAYQWQQSIDGGATWTTINGATGISYAPGILSPGVFKYRRLAAALCNHISNAVTVTVETSLTNYGITASQTICENAPPDLLTGQQPGGGSGAYTYQWQTSADGATWTNIPNATGRDYQPNALVSSTSYRRITSGGQCPAISNAVLISVNALPNGSITAPSGICDYENGSIAFTATKGTAPFTIQLQITAPNGAVTNLNRTAFTNGPESFTVLPVNSLPGVYKIALKGIADINNCPRTAGLNTVDILVTAKPVLTISQAIKICEGSSANLVATGADTYSWTTNNGTDTYTGNAINVKPVVTTTYTVIGATNGCTATANVTVSVTAKPSVPVVTPQVNYCQDAAATALTATTTGNNTLIWYTASSFTAGSSVAPTPSTSTAGTIFYYVTQKTSDGCESDPAMITVIINPKPAVDFSMPGVVCMPDGMATFTNRTAISDGSALTYQWSFGDNSPVTTDVNGTHVYASSGSYAVSLIARSSSGCTNTKGYTFSSFSDKPVADFNVNPDEVCQGKENVFSDHSSPAGTISKWNWNFDDGSAPSAAVNPTYTYKLPGTYTVALTVTNNAGCLSDPFTKDVKVHLQPVIDAGPNIVAPAGSLVQLKATANDSTVVSFLWSPASNLSSPTTLRPTLIVSQNLTYTLTATGPGGCTASDFVTVQELKVVKVPNAFSPNGDGINDTWTITNLSDYPGAKVEVYNRWGQVVMVSKGYSQPWNGNYSGKPLPVGTYYYVITLNNGFAPISGSVMIIK